MTVTIKVGHVLDKLAEMPAESVHCVWTSIPYWGLRSYGTEPQVWGGSRACNHQWGEKLFKPRNGAGRHGKTSQFIQQSRSVTEAQVSGSQATKGQFCRHCGAWRGEHGLEPTLEMWIANEVTIWRGIRRVLRKDGVAWLNCGDAYSTGPKGNPGNRGGINGGKRDEPDDDIGSTFDKSASGLASKQRLMLPARVALALQADGWWLRDEIVWAKLNPMPSSVTDRTTPAHEMLYMLTKSARYYFDAVAIMEPSSKDSHARAARGRSTKHKWADGGPGDQTIAKKSPIAGSVVVAVPGVAPKAALIEGTGKGHPKSNASFNAALGTADLVAMRNRRSVWPLVTEPYPNPHFATAPTSIVEPCILAGTSEKGCCPKCLAPWKRVVRHNAMISKPGPTKDAAAESRGNAANGRQALYATMVSAPMFATIGWYPTCRCYLGVPPLWPYPEKPEKDVEGIRPWEDRVAAVDETNRRICELIADKPVQACTVLDPFGGSGTTALVADRRGRDGILIELNPDYAGMAHERVKGETPLFTKVDAA